MPLTELNIRFPTHNQVIVKFDDDETELLEFKSPVSKKDLDDLRWYIETYGAQYTGEPDDEEARRIEAKLKTLGDALFNAVFTTPKAQDLFQQFQQQPTDKLLSIQTDEPEILALPWELLRDPHSHFLCHAQPRISIRRHCVKNLPASFTIQAKPKLRLLFVVSRPNDVSFLDPRLDPQAVLDALAEQEISQIEVEFLRPATLRKLDERLENKDLPPVDIIHFDGHGWYDEKQQQGYLLFENSRGIRSDISAEQLNNILTPHHIALVVLSACQSAAVGNKALGSVAAGLTDKGVPTVLAMVYSVLVETTRQLFAAFYQALATGQGIAAALDHARLALASENKRGTRRRGEGEFELTLQDWFVPALYQTNHDDALLLKDPRGFQNLAGLSISNLPQLQTAGFFGRSRELWQIERWFVQGVERITLTGFGGQGKTYCAIEAAHWLLRTDLFDSVCFVDFSRYQGLDALRYALNALGVLLNITIQFEQNDKDKLKLELQEKLGTQRLLWVWDNLESLADETLNELLTVAVQWSAHSRFLFTTRQHRFTQADYAESNPKHHYLDLAGLAELDALAYFNQLWQTAPPPEQQYPARYELITLFNKVAFHPLSIGLLAQQLKTRTIAELGERLEALLLCEPENSEDKSLLASLKLSLERLPPEQRELVKRLGVFQGGAFENIVLDVTEINQSEWSMLRLNLENSGLIQVEDLSNIEITFPYIKFYPTLALALWQDISGFQKNKILLRYQQCYYEFSEFLCHQDSKNFFHIRIMAMKELSNLFYAAMKNDEEITVKIAVNTLYFLEIFQLNRDKKTLLNFFLKLSNNVSSDNWSLWYLLESNKAKLLLDEGEYLQAENILKNLITYLFYPPSYELCTILTNLARCYTAQFKFPEAIKYYQQALQQALKVAEREEFSIKFKQLIAAVHSDLANIFRDNQDYTQAKYHYGQSLKATEETETLRDEAKLLGQYGSLALAQGDLKEAEYYYKSALEKNQDINEPLFEAITWYQLGRVYQEAEKLKAAEEAYRKSMKIDETHGNLVSVAMTYSQLALINIELNNTINAENWYRKAITVNEKIGNSKEKASNLYNLAHLLINNPLRLKEARQLVEEAVTINESLDESITKIWNDYELLAQIADNQQQSQQAKEYRRLSYESYFRFKNMPYETMEQSTKLKLITFTLVALSKNEQLPYLKAYLQTAPKNWQKVTTIIQKILDGERNEVILLESLNYGEAAIIHLILKGIANPESLDDLFNS